MAENSRRHLTGNSPADDDIRDHFKADFDGIVFASWRSIRTRVSCSRLELGTGDRPVPGTKIKTGLTRGCAILF